MSTLIFLSLYLMCALDGWACLGTSHAQLLRQHVWVALLPCSLLDVACKLRVLLLIAPICWMMKRR